MEKFRNCDNLNCNHCNRRGIEPENHSIDRPYNEPNCFPENHPIDRPFNIPIKPNCFPENHPIDRPFNIPIKPNCFPENHPIDRPCNEPNCFQQNSEFIEEYSEPNKYHPTKKCDDFLACTDFSNDSDNLSCKEQCIDHKNKCISHNKEYCPCDEEYSQYDSDNNYQTDIKQYPHQNLQNPHAQNFPNEPMYKPFLVTDEYLLNYLLKKYKLDKHKLVQMIKKTKENEFKMLVLKDFYEDCENIQLKPVKEQYQLFKRWNHSGIWITKEELENYYEKYIKQ
jgi:sulfur relay (sulfurtransferase) DsrF/TusC family protein